MDAIQTLLDCKPFAMDTASRRPLFLAAMKQACRWHLQRNLDFQRVFNGFDIENCDSLEELPYLPVEIFKQSQSTSVSAQEIIRVVESSGTSGQPSRVTLDELTISRQQRALTAILSDYLGGERKHFLVFDHKQSMLDERAGSSSRSSGLRGMTVFARSMQFLLDERLDLDPVALKRAILKIPADSEVCIWAFTWMLHNACMQLASNHELAAQLRAALSMAGRVWVLHVGGWKNLENKRVSKTRFTELAASTLGLSTDAIVDVYGMTEHLGTVYLDDQFGTKSVSAYSDILIRDVDRLCPLPNGEIGRIQLLTPIPHSYPGVSILTTDLGRIEGIDDCPTGRKGKYFTFQGRIE